MSWIKKGLIYKVEKKSNWAYSHTHKPSTIFISRNILRIYFGVRDMQNITRTTFIDVQPDKPEKILYIHDKPVIDIGELGSFDDSGVNVSCLAREGSIIYMYYIAWNPSLTVPTRNSIGLAISEDNGLTFNKIFNAPVVDRNRYDPFYIGACDVIKVNNIWKMYYTSGKRWKIIKSKPEIWYYIRYAESINGIDWKIFNLDCIKPKNEFECIARPSVIFENGKYKMWFCYRDMLNFRIDKSKSYRIGYAESKDGKSWERIDKKVDIDVASIGWDSEMIAYPEVYKFKNKYYMIYNGNKFGQTGFGYAILENEFK